MLKTETKNVERLFEIHTSGNLGGSLWALKCSRAGASIFGYGPHNAAMWKCLGGPGGGPGAEPRVVALTPEASGYFSGWWLARRRRCTVTGSMARPRYIRTRRRVFSPWAAWPFTGHRSRPL